MARRASLRHGYLKPVVVTAVVIVAVAWIFHWWVRPNILAMSDVTNEAFKANFLTLSGLLWTWLVEAVDKYGYPVFFLFLLLVVTFAIDFLSIPILPFFHKPFLQELVQQSPRLLAVLALGLILGLLASQKWLRKPRNQPPPGGPPTHGIDPKIFTTF